MPMKEGTNFGGMYEYKIRENFNKIGKYTFVEGAHNTGEDLTCLENPRWSLELKTRKNLSFNNTNDNGRTHESTKYNGTEDQEEYYLLVQHDMDIDNIPYKTKPQRIFFGLLCKNDFTNPNGTGAAYLKSDIRIKKCIEIWNYQIGNTIDNYQAWLYNDYYEKMVELENIL